MGAIKQDHLRNLERMASSNNAPRKVRRERSAKQMSGRSTPRGMLCKHVRAYLSWGLICAPLLAKLKVGGICFHDSSHFLVQGVQKRPCMLDSADRAARTTTRPSPSGCPLKRQGELSPSLTRHTIVHAWNRGVIQPKLPTKCRRRFTHCRTRTSPCPTLKQRLNTQRPN